MKYKKYSSFDKQQLITESFRRFINEEEDPYDCLAAETKEEYEDCLAASETARQASGYTPGLEEAEETVEESEYINAGDARHRKARARYQNGTSESLEEEADKEAKRTAKGNITQATREKYATVGKDGFPIFDEESAIAAIDLRGHASEADQKKIINKAAKFAPKEAKAAREKDKKKNEGRLRKKSGKKIVVEISRRKKKETRR